MCYGSCKQSRPGLQVQFKYRESWTQHTYFGGRVTVRRHPYYAENVRLIYIIRP